MEPARDPFEELTSLYLGEPSPNPGTSVCRSEPARRASLEPVRITVAVCGNLPVMAGIWVTQYADLEAARSGPTGLVRLDGGRCSFELLRAGREPGRLEGDAMPKAAASLAGEIRRWIVCVDDRDAAAAVRAGADELVVLTSADQLALVEAYRLVKSARARAADPETLDLGVVIAGANEQASERAAALLDEMSARHLGVSLPVIAMVRRLDVVEQSHRIAFEESLRGDPGDVVAALREAADAETTGNDDGSSPRLRLAESVDESLEESADESMDDLASLLASLDDADAEPPAEYGLEVEVDPDVREFDAIFGSDEAPEPPAPREPAPSSKRDRTLDRERQRPRRPFPIRLGPAPSQAVDRPAFIDLEEFDTVGADAASRIGPGRGSAVEAPAAGLVPASEIEPKPTDAGLVSAVDGLSAIDWPFVAAKGVRGAIDGEGRLHLLCRDVDHGQLDIARHWAASHARQIAGYAGITEGAVRAPVLHVVTDHAPRVANLHRTGVHLHLVVEAAGEWISVPLNDDDNREMR